MKYSNPGQAAAREESRVTSLTGEMSESLLPNGVRVLTERIPGVRSVSVGVWVRQGAAHELPEVMGASHLLEHMVFKGTLKRTSREIALALEGLGGSLDAYTSREHTSFQARVLDEHLPVALDEIPDGVYWLTDGHYQMMFVLTGDGVIAVDAPPSLGENILAAIAEVTELPVRAQAKP